MQVYALSMWVTRCKSISDLVVKAHRRKVKVEHTYPDPLLKWYPDCKKTFHIYFVFPDSKETCNVYFVYSRQYEASVTTVRTRQQSPWALFSIICCSLCSTTSCTNVTVVNVLFMVPGGTRDGHERVTQPPQCKDTNTSSQDEGACSAFQQHASICASFVYVLMLLSVPGIEVL